MAFPRGLIDPADKARLVEVLAARDAIEVDVRSAVLAAAKRGASVRELASFTGISASTISRWKRTDSSA